MTLSRIPAIEGLPVIGNLADFSREAFFFPHEIAPQHGRLVRHERR